MVQGGNTYAPSRDCPVATLVSVKSENTKSKPYIDNKSTNSVQCNITKHILIYGKFLNFGFSHTLCLCPEGRYCQDHVCAVLLRTY